MLKSDISNQRFGYWTVICRDPEYKSQKHSKWICKCDCGTIKSVFKESLQYQKSLSCGCRPINYKGINATHGMSKTRIYHEWLCMRNRCTPNSRYIDYKNYYGRGITVCDEWKNDFTSFQEWAVNNGYSDTLSLDRINNDLGYSPDNCRWISLGEQQSNKRNNIFIEYNLKQYCLRALCKELNFPYKTAHRRLQRMKAKGLSVDVDKLFEPIHTDKIAFRYRK